MVMKLPICPKCEQEIDLKYEGALLGSPRLIISYCINCTKKNERNIGRERNFPKEYLYIYYSLKRDELKKIFGEWKLNCRFVHIV
jgi:hypothetical protein